MSREKATWFVIKRPYGVRVPSGKGNMGTEEEKETEEIIIYKKNTFFPP